MYQLQTGRRFPAPLRGAGLGEVSTVGRVGIGLAVGLGLLFLAKKTKLGRKLGLSGYRRRRRR